MAYAAVTYVDLEGRDSVENLRMLNDTLVPMLKSLQGFQSARFLRSEDQKTGAGAVILDTKAQATACLDLMTSQRPADAPPVTGSGIYELMLEV